MLIRTLTARTDPTRFGGGWHGARHARLAGGLPYTRPGLLTEIFSRSSMRSHEHHPSSRRSPTPTQHAGWKGVAGNRGVFPYVRSVQRTGQALDEVSCRAKKWAPQPVWERPRRPGGQTMGEGTSTVAPFDRPLGVWGGRPRSGKAGSARNGRWPMWAAGVLSGARAIFRRCWCCWPTPSPPPHLHPCPRRPGAGRGAAVSVRLARTNMTAYAPPDNRPRPTFYPVPYGLSFHPDRVRRT